MERSVRRLAQLFEAGRKHFLLEREIQIESEKKLVPCSLSPAQFSIVTAQCRRGICFGACSAREVEKCVPVIISRCPLQRVTDRRGERQEPDRRRRTSKCTAKRQMNVDAGETQMIGNAINDAPLAAFLMS